MANYKGYLKDKDGNSIVPSHAEKLVVENVVCKNLLYTPYTEDNKLTATATKSDYYVHTDYNCYLEAGKEYTFSCKTDGVWAVSGSSDTVEVYLIKDKTYDDFIGMQTNPCTFTPATSGYYYIRYDINGNGATHSFWDFQIEEGPDATNYVENKEFSNKQTYSLDEKIIGLWVNNKPLYRKVVAVTISDITLGSIINIRVDHNIVNIEFGWVELATRALNDADVYSYGSSGYINAANNRIQWFLNATQISASVDRDIDNGTWYVSICYTKTTD